MADLPVADEKAWHALRATNIGGSEAAGLFSLWGPEDPEAGAPAALHGWEAPPDGWVPVGPLSPYHDPHTLWLLKRGKMQPDFDADNERIQAGTFLEPAIAEWSRTRWGWPIRKVRRYTMHDNIAGWGASADFELNTEGRPVVEIKNVDFLVARDKWHIEDDMVLAVPLHIQMQLQHMMGARNGREAWVVACIGGNKLVRGRFERHEPTIARIGEAIDAFWQAVRTETHPRSGLSADGCAEEFRRGVRSTTPLDLTADNELPTLVAHYKKRGKELEAVKMIHEEIGAAIKLKVGTATSAIFQGGRIAWPVVEREEKMVLQKAKTYRGGLTITLKP